MSLLAERLADLPDSDQTATAAVTERAAQTLRPPGALQWLDDIAAWKAGWQRSATPTVEQPAVLVFAGDHGVTAAGVSSYPSDVTAAMLRATQNGQATINAFARSAGASVTAIDVGVGDPTGDMRSEAALSSERFDAITGTAFDAVEALDTDLLVLGELGIGNTTAAAAIADAAAKTYVARDASAFQAAVRAEHVWPRSAATPRGTCSAARPSSSAALLLVQEFRARRLAEGAVDGALADKARDAAGNETALSAPAGASTEEEPPAPEPPTAVTALSASDNADGSATLRWDDAANESAYVIVRESWRRKGRRWVGRSELASLAADSTAYTDASGTGRYRYLVRSTNDVGSVEGAWAEVVVTGEGG